MEKLRGLLSVLVIGACILQANFGECYKNEVEITPSPPEEATTKKSGFFGGLKNFFRGSPSTTTTTTIRPSLLIPQAPLMPLGPRPDTPSSSPFDARQQQPPQWPQVGPSVPSTLTTTVRPYSPLSSNQPQQPHPQITIGQGQRFGSGSTSFQPGFTPRQDKPQPSGYDLSYGGGNAGDGSLSASRPGYRPSPMTSSTTTTTTIRPSTAHLPVGPAQQPLSPNVDMRFGSTMTTTTRLPTQKDEFPGLPPPHRPSTGSHNDFPPLPTPKLPVPTPNSPISHPSSPSAWGTTPIPPQHSLIPSFPAPKTPNPPGSPAAQPHGTGNRVSFIPSVSTSTTVRPGTQSSGENSLATDEEIRQLTENLYAKENNNLLDLIQVNIQGKTRSIDNADEAPNPLLTVDDRALQLPTIVKMRDLFNNYDVDTSVNEHVTPNERREENEFLDAVMSTSIMRQAMLFLQNKEIVSPDPKTHRDLVKELWFTQYSRGRGRIGSSGFEHVFVNEVNNGTLIGLHNWVYFYEEEKAGRLDYKGYMKVLDIGTKAKIVKARFTLSGLNKPVNTLFIGTSPELELALYTVCLKLRPSRGCPISMGNARFDIIVYPWRYRGKNLIGSAYPEI